jgi:hypothetical protein
MGPPMARRSKAVALTWARASFARRRSGRVPTHLAATDALT